MAIATLCGVKDGARLGGVCGCDGVVYTNTCDAHRIGLTNVGPIDRCAVPEGRFVCGNELCDPAQHACCPDANPARSRCVVHMRDACRNQPIADCSRLGDASVLPRCRVIAGETPGLEIECIPGTLPE
jgi:hypothetical protein